MRAAKVHVGRKKRQRRGGQREGARECDGLKQEWGKKYLDGLTRVDTSEVDRGGQAASDEPGKIQRRATWRRSAGELKHEQSTEAANRGLS